MFLWCFGGEKNQRKMVWMIWPWQNWGESKIGNRGRGGKEALADKTLDFENPVQQQAWALIGLVLVTYNWQVILLSSAILCRLQAPEIEVFNYLCKESKSCCHNNQQALQNRTKCHFLWIWPNISVVLIQTSFNCPCSKFTPVTWFWFM